MKNKLYTVKVRYYCELAEDMVTEEVNLHIDTVSNTQRSVIMAALRFFPTDCGYVFVYNPESKKARSDGWVQMHDYDNPVF